MQLPAESSKRITIIIDKVASINNRFKRKISEADISLNHIKHSKKRMYSLHPNLTIEEDWIIKEPVKEHNHQHTNDGNQKKMSGITLNDSTPIDELDKKLNHDDNNTCSTENKEIYKNLASLPTQTESNISERQRENAKIDSEQL
ncbi:hypothetical protein GJ496_006813 [Pomphorhynchus laevis]|nr:hypothetical protein GJ496_006813 [Pomphorhynchus laevis]